MALLNSVTTTAVLTAVDSYLLINAGSRLLMPRLPGGGPESLITVNKPFRGGFRFRGGPFMGLVRYYMRQLLSARGGSLGGMVVGGALMAVFLYVSLATSVRGGLTQFELIIGVMAYAAPLAS